MFDIQLIIRFQMYMQILHNIFEPVFSKGTLKSTKFVLKLNKYIYIIQKRLRVGFIEGLSTAQGQTWDTEEDGGILEGGVIFGNSKN